MLKFSELLEYCKVESIACLLEPTEESVWRSIARSYSEKFSTPLHVVMNELDPSFVILNLYESQLEGINVESKLEKLMDIVYQIEDPSYIKQQKEDMDEFVQMIEERERQRIEKLSKNTEKEVKPVETAKTEPELTLPKSGGINLSYLDRADLEG